MAEPIKCDKARQYLQSISLGYRLHEYTITVAAGGVPRLFVPSNPSRILLAFPAVITGGEWVGIKHPSGNISWILSLGQFQTPTIMTMATHYSLPCQEWWIQDLGNETLTATGIEKTT